MAEFDDGEFEADLVVAADGIHSAAQGAALPRRGRLPLERLVALAGHRRGGARARRTLHDLGRASGAEVRRLPDRRPARGQAEVQLHRRAAAPRLRPGPGRGLESPRFARRLPAPVQGMGLRLAGRARHCGGGTRDLPLPHGGPGADSAMDLRPDHAPRRCRAPDVSHRLQRRLPGHPRCPCAGRLPPAARRRRRRGPAALRGDPAARHGGHCAGEPWSSDPSSPCSSSRSARPTASPTSPM